MKRKVKRYDTGGYGRFVEESPKSVEDMKSGIAAGSPAVEEDTGMRAGKNLAFEPDTTPKAKPRAAAPKVKTGSGASGFGLNPREKDLQSASDVMKKGFAGKSDSGKNVALESYKRDKKEREFNEARKAAAEERRNTARSTVASSPVTGAGFKKGGMAKSASARADGCAIRGKTRA